MVGPHRAGEAHLGVGAHAAGQVGAALVVEGLDEVLDVPGPVSIVALLQRLELNRETVLVIRSGTLVPGDAILEDTDEVEIRPVISGGAA